MVVCGEGEELETGSAVIVVDLIGFWLGQSQTG